MIAKAVPSPQFLPLAAGQQGRSRSRLGARPELWSSWLSAPWTYREAASLPLVGLLPVLTFSGSPTPFENPMGYVILPLEKCAYLGSQT